MLAPKNTSFGRTDFVIYNLVDIHPFSTRVFHSTLPTLELGGPTEPFLSCEDDRTLGICFFFGFVSLVTLYHGKSSSTTFWDMFF